ncbi:MAG TPA: tetratricopeptide repeat protein [bacterium]|nr:tetratricopeptide repeat protein [bacterium]
MLAEFARRDSLIGLLGVLVLAPQLVGAQVGVEPSHRIKNAGLRPVAERPFRPAPSPAIIYDFAESLFRDKDYETAAIQYRLLLHLKPDFELSARCRIKTALCYIMLGKFDEAQTRLGEMLSDETLLKRWDELSLWQAVCFLSERDYVGALARLTVLSRDARAPDVRAYASYLLAWTFLSLGDWAQAARVFTRLSRASSEASALAGIKMEVLAEAAASGKLLQQKSPVVAGLLSACVPGAGHFYCRKFRNGGVAFVLNAAFVAASVEAFHKDVYVGGAIASSVALVFYSGTIYGAVNVAHKFNRTRREQLLSEMRRKFGDERLLLIDRLYR